MNSNLNDKPHESSSLLTSIGFIPHNQDTPRQLTTTEANKLTNALYKDSKGYLYNGILSIGSGIQSIQKRNYGWATVKFYYSVYYLARARLNIRKIGLVYDKSKPFSIISKAGESLTKCKGVTHKIIKTLFEENFSSDILVRNKINGQDSPLEWLMKQRELMNYKSVVMPDPIEPEQYQEITNKNIRVRLSTYLSDDREVYTFDSDHACLAYPVKFLIYTLKEFEIQKEEFEIQKIDCDYLEQHQEFIQKLFSDKKGSFLPLLKPFEL